MMMQFMSRHDQIVKAVPFVPGLAEWGFDQKLKLPYHWRLLKRANEPANYSGDVVFTDQIKIYEFWQHVKGSRVVTSSTDGQLLTEAFVDGHQAFLIINNLSTEPVTLDVPALRRGIKPTKVFVKHLYFHEGKVQLDGRYFEAGSKSLVVGPEASLQLICDFEKPLVRSNRVQEKKHFATTQFAEIVKGVRTKYAIKGVKMHKEGAGTLRIAIGRDHGLVLQPHVIFNGNALALPDTYRGPAQKDRPLFFGVLEIPVPNRFIEKSNIIDVQFADSGGKISAVSLVRRTPATTAGQE